MTTGRCFEVGTFEGRRALIDPRSITAIVEREVGCILVAGATIHTLMSFDEAKSALEEYMNRRGAR